MYGLTSCLSDLKTGIVDLIMIFAVFPFPLIKWAIRYAPKFLALDNLVATGPSIFPSSISGFCFKSSLNMFVVFLSTLKYRASPGFNESEVILFAVMFIYSSVVVPGSLMSYLSTFGF